MQQLILQEGCLSTGQSLGRNFVVLDKMFGFEQQIHHWCRCSFGLYKGKEARHNFPINQFSIPCAFLLHSILYLESMNTTIYAYTMQTFVTCLTAEINKQTIRKVNLAVALIQTHSVGFANFSNIILLCQAACKGFYIAVQKAHFTISFIPDNCRHSQWTSSVDKLEYTSPCSVSDREDRNSEVGTRISTMGGVHEVTSIVVLAKEVKDPWVSHSVKL